VPAHRDLDLRERVLAEHGVDLQVLTLTTPGVHGEEPARAAELARRILAQAGGFSPPTLR
jgi:hypothetical protein